MNEWFEGANMHARLTELWQWLQTNVLVMNSLVQLIFIGAALLIATYVSLWLGKTYPEYFAHKRQDYKKLSLKDLAYKLLRRLIMPTLFWLILVIGGLIFAALGKQTLLVSTVTALVVAWIVIRFGSAFIVNPVVSRLVATVVWIVAALHIVGWWPQTIEYLEKASFSIGSVNINLLAIAGAALYVTLFLWIALIVVNFVEARIRTSEHINASVKVLFSKLFKLIVITVAVILALQMVGVDLTAFAVVGGAIGVGIGFGLQKIFSNLIAGIILLMDKSIKPGDTIEIAGTYGRVDKLGARYVSVITRDGIEHLLPNEELIINRVENWSHSHTLVRLHIPVGVHYNSDVEQAMELCVQAAESIHRVLADPKPKCLLRGFGDSSVDLEIRIWVRDPMNGCGNVKSQVLLKVWHLFKEHNIEIPYPQRDVHLFAQQAQAFEGEASKEVNQ